MGGPDVIRVGLVIYQLTLGGGECQLRELVRGLEGAGFLPIVYCLSRQVAPVGDLLRSQGVTLRVAPCGGPLRWQWLAAAWMADRLQLVHSWLFPANAVAGLAHLQTPWLPLITCAGDTSDHGLLNRAANRLAFRTSRAILVNSQGLADHLVERYSAPEDRIRVIPNGVDCQRFCPDPDREQAFQGPIVAIGRLVPEKNHSLFLTAAAALERRFLLVGDGPLRDHLEVRARELDLEGRLTFTGLRLDVERLLGQAALLWLTSDREGMPNVVTEALASGVPVIATDVYGVRELIRPGVEGYIVGLGEAAGFVEHSRALLGQRSLWDEMSSAARRRAQEFSSERMVGATTAVYRKVLEI